MILNPSSIPTRDQEIIKLKYKSPQVGTMPEVDFSLTVKSLLLKIHVITGWEIPEGELMKILVDQFGKKLIETYPDLNTDEIEYSFRHDTQVKDWGKSMNLQLIDEVLSDYIVERYRLSHALEERNATPPPQVILTDKQLDDILRKDIEDFYQRCRSGQIPHKVPDYFKEILVKDGLLKQDESIANFFVQRLGNGFENIYVPA